MNLARLQALSVSGEQAVIKLFLTLLFSPAVCSNVSYHSIFNRSCDVRSLRVHILQFAQVLQRLVSAGLFIALDTFTLLQGYALHCDSSEIAVKMMMT